MLKLREVLLEVEMKPLLLELLMLLQSEVEVLNRYGLDVVERYDVDPYIMLLLKKQHSNYFTVSLTTADSPFTRPTDQQHKPSQQDVSVIFRAWKKLVARLSSWVNQHEKIEVGSFNKERTHKYKDAISRFGLKCGPVQDAYGGNFFYVTK